MVRFGKDMNERVTHPLCGATYDPKSQLMERGGWDAIFIEALFSIHICIFIQYPRPAKRERRRNADYEFVICQQEI